MQKTKKKPREAKVKFADKLNCQFNYTNLIQNSLKVFICIDTLKVYI